MPLSVAREQAVEAATGVLQDLLRLLELLLVADLRHLHRCYRQALCGAAQVVELVRRSLADRLPRGSHSLAAGLDVSLALVGERERLAALLLDDADEPLVLELRERGIDRAG